MKLPAVSPTLEQEVRAAFRVGSGEIFRGNVDLMLEAGQNTLTQLRSGTYEQKRLLGEDFLPTEVKFRRRPLL